MAVYQYRVRDQKSGKILSSQVEADSMDQVRSMLRAKNLMVIDIQAPKTGLQGDVNIPFLSNRPPGLKVITVFSRQLATLVNAGVPLVQGVNIMQRQTENKVFFEVLRKVKNDLETGLPFSEAIAKYPRIFDRFFVNLVRAGETSGQLDKVLDRVAYFQEKDLALRGKIKSAMTYPTIVFIFAIVITVLLLTTVVPQFGGILQQLGGQLPGITRFLMSISDFIMHRGLVLVAIIAVIVVAYRQYYKTDKGRHVIDDIKLKLPVFGPLAKRSAIASFTRTFALLLQSGVNIIESLDITKSTINNIIIQDAIDNARNVVMVGEQMSGSFAASPVFPPMVISMISIGEETGSLDSMLDKVADFYDREVDEAVESLTAAIEPIMIVFLGAIVGTIVAGMFLPMFSIIQTLSK